MDQYETVLPSNVRGGTRNPHHGQRFMNAHPQDSMSMTDTQPAEGSKSEVNNDTNKSETSKLTANKYIIFAVCVVVIILIIVIMYQSYKSNSNAIPPPGSTQTYDTMPHPGYQQQQYQAQQQQQYYEQQEQQSQNNRNAELDNRVQDQKSNKAKSSIGGKLFDTARRVIGKTKSDDMKHAETLNTPPMVGKDTHKMETIVEEHIQEELNNLRDDEYDYSKQDPGNDDSSDESEKIVVIEDEEEEEKKSLCDFILVGGKRAGQVCGRKCATGKTRCSSHVGK